MKGKTMKGKTMKGKTMKGKTMKGKTMKSKMIILGLVLVILNASVVDAKPLKGQQSYSWSKTRFAGPNVGNIYETWSAKYDNWSGQLIIKNLSGTKRWTNYNNRKKGAQSMSIGISKTLSVAKTYSYKLSTQLGLQSMSENKTISTTIGGDYTKSKTYSKTVGTSSAYVIDTKSKNGYYAICHCVNADRYKTTYKKSGGAGTANKKGELYRFTTSKGYEALIYRKDAF